VHVDRGQSVDNSHCHDSELIASSTNSAFECGIGIHQFLRFVTLEGSENVGNKGTDKSSYSEIHLEGAVVVLTNLEVRF
jgi:hypothetical protein